MAARGLASRSVACHGGLAAGSNIVVRAGVAALRRCAAGVVRCGSLIERFAVLRVAAARDAAFRRLDHARRSAAGFVVRANSALAASLIPAWSRVTACAAAGAAALGAADVASAVQHSSAIGAGGRLDAWSSAADLICSANVASAACIGACRALSTACATTCATSLTAANGLVTVPNAVIAATATRCTQGCGNQREQQARCQREHSCFHVALFGGRIAVS